MLTSSWTIVSYFPSRQTIFPKMKAKELPVKKAKPGKVGMPVKWLKIVFLEQPHPELREYGLGESFPTSSEETLLVSKAIGLLPLTTQQ